MEFDWRKAIDRNCEELCTIAARLIVMAGIVAGRSVETVPRHLYLRILATLRPAEYAARRLIAMAACKLYPDIRLPLTNEETVRGLPRAKEKADSGVSAATEDVSSPRDESDNARPPFSPRGRRWMRAFRERTQTDEGEASDHAPSSGPSGHLLPQREKEDRIPAFALFDPLKRFGHPWLEPGDPAGPDAHDLRFALPPCEPVDARSLCRRIRALADALSGLDGQALRLARWRARRDAEAAACSRPGSTVEISRLRPRRWSPIRPGRPPGWRKRPKTAVEEALKECHMLAREAWDTS